MKLSMKLSFEPIPPRTVAKFQTDRFGACRKNPREKKTPGKTYIIAAATLR